MTTQLSDDLLVGVKAAAEFTGLTARSLYHLVETDRIPYTRKGQRLFFRKSELERAFTSDQGGVIPV